MNWPKSLMTDKIEPPILRKSEIIQRLGKGAYGIVWKAIDKKYKKAVNLQRNHVIIGG